MRPHLAAELLVDGSLRTLAVVRRGLRGGAEPPVRTPGAHEVLRVRPCGSGENRYLRAGRLVWSFWRTIEWRLLEPVARALPDPVADVGCGDGEFGALLRDRIEYGIDAEEPFLAHCRDSPVYGEVLRADVRQGLRVPDGSLAAAFSNSTLEHIVPVRGALESVARALRPGGRFVFTVPGSGFRDALAEAFGDAYSRRLNDSFAHRNLWDARRWENELREAGFGVVTHRGYMTRAAARWIGRLELKQHRMSEKRNPERHFDRHLPDLLDLARRSLETSDEGDTACLLVDAVR